MPTLSELAGFGAGTSPLGLLSGAVDERTRYYANIVRGLLDNPAALVDQLRAQNAENVRGRARDVQDTRSVMPQVADPAKQAAFDEAMNIGLLGMTVSKPSYQGQHAAPMRDSGSPLHDLTLNKTYPSDVYQYGAKWYGTGEDLLDNSAFNKVFRFRGKPDEKVVVFRAVPVDAPMKLNKGDWVTINRQYAADHGNREFGKNHKDWKMIRKEVPAKDIYTNGDSILEWGYDPS